MCAEMRGIEVEGLAVFATFAHQLSFQQCLAHNHPQRLELLAPSRRPHHHPPPQDSSSSGMYGV